MVQAPLQEMMMMKSTERVLYTDLMFDIETLGTAPDAPILSIAAVPFNPYTGMILYKGACFHKAVELQAELDAGAKPLARTLLWWLDQSDAARRGLLEGQADCGKPVDVIEALASFCEVHGMDLNNVRVWGNGANFDITLLEQFYARHGQIHPWKFWNVRCFRTLKQLINSVDTPALARPAVAHDALEDAFSQAMNAIQIIHSLPVQASQV